MWGLPSSIHSPFLPSVCLPAQTPIISTFQLAFYIWLKLPITSCVSITQKKTSHILLKCFHACILSSINKKVYTIIIILIIAIDPEQHSLLGGRNCVSALCCHPTLNLFIFYSVTRQPSTLYHLLQKNLYLAKP